MGKISLGVIIFISLIIQGSLFLFLPLKRGFPDILLILVACFSILWGSRKGAIIGIFSGFLQDILYGPVIGMFAMTKMLVGYLAGYTEKNIYEDFVVGPMVIVFALTFLHEGLALILSREIMHQPLGPVVMEVILPKALYNFCLTPFVYLAVFFANRKNFFYPFS